MDLSRPLADEFLVYRPNGSHSTESWWWIKIKRGVPKSLLPFQEKLNCLYSVFSFFSKTKKITKKSFRSEAAKAKVGVPFLVGFP